MLPEISPWLADTRVNWESSVDAWLTEVAMGHGLGQITSVTTLKERPWSLVRRIDFENQITYFKACGALGAFEPRLLLFLQENAIEFGPEILAVELNQHWFLMADGGPRLREEKKDMALAEQLAAALTSYAEMQISSAGWISKLIDFGLPDRRMSQVPALLGALLADDVISTGHSAEKVAKLRAAAAKALPALESACNALNQSPFANGLDHGDLHTANLLVSGEHYCLIDWGDACITHPFCSMSVTLETVLNEVPIAEQAMWSEILRDAYLKPWADHYPQDRLYADFERALWVGQATRALDYAYMFVGADEETLDQWRTTILGQLQRWVDAWNEQLWGDVKL